MLVVEGACSSFVLSELLVGGVIAFEDNSTCFRDLELEMSELAFQAVINFNTICICSFFGPICSIFSLKV